MVTSKITWKVTENNAGGLTLYVWKGKRLIYAHAGYEYTQGQLATDIAALNSGGDPAAEGYEWAGNDLFDENIIIQVRGSDNDLCPLTQTEYYDNHPSTRVIATNREIAPADEMGAAGRSEFHGAQD